MTPTNQEEVLKDEQGRTFCIVRKNFWQYVDKKRMTREKVLKLSPEGREEFFMRWKHGMLDNSTNWAFEYNLRQFLKIYEDEPLDQIDPSWRMLVKWRREFEVYCNQIRAELALTFKKKDLPQEVQDVADAMGGEVVSMEAK